MMCCINLISSSVSLRLPPSPLGKADKLHSSPYTTENIIKPQFRKLHLRICRYKKPSPAWEDDEEDKTMTHNSMCEQISVSIFHTG